ncbi:hypothetical protein MMC07_008182 [Pseudocyphellaria aurata]|nr:hypothetical protein [Pseudocyphellaria aurata]
MSTSPQNLELHGVRETQGGVALPPSSEKIQNKFDLSIALTLATWSALTLAVQNLWGGPQSADKRDWFAGAISELIESTPDADVEYVEQFLLQVMNDEFDIHVDDGSGEEIAAKIVGLRKLTLQGNFTMVDEMLARWQERQSRGGGTLQFRHVERREEDDETDWDSDDKEDNSADEDVEMEQAPPLVKIPKEKVQPTVDDDGFTEVVGKRRR